MQTKRLRGGAGRLGETRALNADGRPLGDPVLDRRGARCSGRLGVVEARTMSLLWNVFWIWVAILAGIGVYAFATAVALDLITMLRQRRARR